MSLDVTLDALRARALAAPDAGGHFPAMYARVTRRVMDRAAAGEFDDPARMARFVATFAGRYLRAVDATGDAVAGAGAAAGDVAPDCWRAAFDVAGDPSLLVVQHLLLGINAHVNHDLPQTVVDVAENPDFPSDLPSIEPDFLAINEVLGQVYDELLADLDTVTRWVGRAAQWGGGWLFNFGLTEARDQAWRAAVRLHGKDGAARAADVAFLDDLVSVGALLVTRPPFPASLVVPRLRRFEEPDPVVVTRALLGPLA